MKELISVIVPIYNSEHSLDKCISSILSQTYDNLEIILIDDGSTDNSPKICDSFAIKDKRIKVIHKKNSGVSSSRNEGLKIATGSYIGFIDSDDWIEDNYFYILYESMKEFSVDVSICGYTSIASDGTESNSTNINQIKKFNRKEAIEAIFEGTIFMGHVWNKLYKVDKIKDICFNENIHMYEDLLFNIQVFINSNYIVFTPSFGYNYIRHSQSACNKINEKYISVIKAYRIMTDVLSKIDSELYIYCYKSEIRCYILTAIRIIENKTNEKQIKKILVTNVRNLIRYNKKIFKLGSKYALLSILLAIGFIPFKLIYLLIGKKLLNNSN